MTRIVFCPEHVLVEITPEPPGYDPTLPAVARCRRLTRHTGECEPRPATPESGYTITAKRAGQ